MPDAKLIFPKESPQIPGETILKLLPAAVYTCDKDGRLTFFNDHATKLWGYIPPLNDDSVKYCPCHKVWQPDGSEITRSQRPMAIALGTGQSFRNVETLVQCANERTLYVSINIDPIFDENGNVSGGICFFQDISHYKQTQRALSESDARYRNLIHNIDVPLYTTDKEGFITMYNDAAAQLWGRQPETDVEKWSGAFKMFYADGTDLAKEDCPQAVCLRESKPIRDTELLVMRPDGSVRHVAPHPQPLFNEEGELTGAVNMLLDLTGIKQTELALRESEQKYRRLAASLERKVEEKSKDLLAKNEELKESEQRYHKMVEDVEDYAIILMDENGIIRNWNKGAEKIKGYSDEEILGKSFELFYLDEDLKKGTPAILLNQARMFGKASAEGWRRRKDGSLFWASIVITALKNDNDKLLGFTKVTRDLTERKIAEDKLKEYSSRLEFQNRELEQFAYAASHDLKEPLRKIHLYHSFISDNSNNHLDEKSREYLERSINSVRRMNTLIEDLLAYSRATSDKEGFTVVNLNNIVDEVISDFREETEQHIAKIERTDLPAIKGIPFQCKQLIENLVENSVKYRDTSRPSHIRILYETVDASSEPVLKQLGQKKYYKVSIIDNGLGFDPEHSEKIFEVFQRLNTQRDRPGSGIGLSICRKIIQHHGGVITATGKRGEGARFDLFFPIDR